MINKPIDRLRLYDVKIGQRFRFTKGGLVYIKDTEQGLHNQSSYCHTEKKIKTRGYGYEKERHTLREQKSFIYEILPDMIKQERREDSEFKQFRRKQIAELRPVTEWDIKAYQVDKEIHSMMDTEFKVSISDADRQNGSPKIGDMIARNPKNHDDQWLVAKQYFEDNFEPVE